ncbi:MAG: hypothetical protein HRF49_05840 [bacterium]|jgi:hypothetical protein
MFFENAILGVVLFAAIVAAGRLFVATHLKSGCGGGSGCCCDKGSAFAGFLDEERKKRSKKEIGR